MRRLVRFIAVSILVVSCGETTRVVGTAPSPQPSQSSSPAASPGSPSATNSGVPSSLPTASAAAARPSPTAPAFDPCPGEERCGRVLSATAAIDPAKMNDHLVALTNVGSRDPRHPGHAKAVAYIKEQLGALDYYGWKLETQRTVYQGIPLENIFATLDPAGAAAANGWVIVSAHYDSTANRTAGWRPA